MTKEVFEKAKQVDQRWVLPKIDNGGFPSFDWQSDIFKAFVYARDRFDEMET